MDIKGCWAGCSLDGGTTWTKVHKCGKTRLVYKVGSIQVKDKVLTPKSGEADFIIFHNAALVKIYL